MSLINNKYIISTLYFRRFLCKDIVNQIIEYFLHEFYISYSKRILCSKYIFTNRLDLRKRFDRYLHLTEKEFILLLNFIKNYGMKNGHDKGYIIIFENFADKEVKTFQCILHGLNIESLEKQIQIDTCHNIGYCNVWFRRRCPGDYFHYNLKSLILWENNIS